jgi:hypothetical protein
MTGASWYKHDVDMSADEKIIYLESVFGLTGYALFNKFLEALARAHDHRLAWNDITRAVFARKFFVDAETLERFIAEATRPEISAFALDDGFVFSPGLSKRMEPLRDKREEYRENISAKKQRKKNYDKERYAQRRATSATETAMIILHDEDQLDLYPPVHPVSGDVSQHHYASHEKTDVVIGEKTDEKTNERKSENNEIPPVHSHKKRQEEMREKKDPHPRHEATPLAPALREEDTLRTDGAAAHASSVEIHTLHTTFIEANFTETNFTETTPSSEVENVLLSEEESTNDDDEFFTNYTLDAAARAALPEGLVRLEGFVDVWLSWVRYRRPTVFAARNSLEVLTSHLRNGYDPRKIIHFTMQASFRVLAYPNETHRLDAPKFDAPKPEAHTFPQRTPHHYSTAGYSPPQQPQRRYIAVEMNGGINPHIPLHTLDFSRAEHLRDEPVLTNEQYLLLKRSNANTIT